MKKMKKFLAMMLAMAMVLGMSITSFAAGATLKVEGAGENATFKKLQVIKADPETVTGWNFTSSEVADAYVSAFGSVGVDGATVVSPQEAIAMLILAADKDAKLPDSLSNVETAATAGQIQKALSNVKQMLSDDFQNMTNGETVDAAGVYAVLANETGYTYSNMAIYVGFGLADDGTYPALTSEPVAAKRAPNTITKENMSDAADDAVAVGDPVEFKVTSSFPYFDANEENPYYGISDVLTGATFDENSVKVTIGGVDHTADVQMQVQKLTAPSIATPVSQEELQIDFRGLIDAANTYASQEVVVTYTATVTEVSVNNTVSHSGTGIEGADPATTNLYTGSITITKYGEDVGTTLEGAEFVVSRQVPSAVVTDEETGDNMAVSTKLEYATFDNAMKLTGWVSEIDDATHVVTGADGTATVNGLDEGSYAFIEVKAPTGYSINEDPSIADLRYDGEKATGIFTTETTMNDTQVSSLPSTGGIGTTIFTVGGCAIMIIAAGLYFSLRRRTAK